ncbi:MAG: inorganic phosphate transporter [Dehalococcoidia bacterium]|nr:inorganic phosphate transporter [Dehalococcoidia bacterium]
MIETPIGLLIIVISLALLFDFANGFHDAANAIATVVSTRVLTPAVAVAMASLMNLLGALSGTAVAKVVGVGIIDPEVVTLTIVAAGVSAAIIWEFVTLYLGMPVSGSHSLIGGVAGAAIATGGFSVVLGSGVEKVFLGMLFSLVFGIFGGYLFMLGLYWLFRRSTASRVNGIFGRLQIVSAAAMAFSHGSNDAQKTMGIISLALFVGGYITTFHIPFWVIFLSATVMALGTSFGGWKIIRTLGVRIVKMRPVNGFAAESAAAAVIETASRLGIPLSTTHTITSTILGQGATLRISAVRWGVARRIVVAWILTFPVVGLLGAGLVKVLEQVIS